MRPATSNVPVNQAVEFSSKISGCLGDGSAERDSSVCSSSASKTVTVEPGQFTAASSFYVKARGSRMHPTVERVLEMRRPELARRYVLHHATDRKEVDEIRGGCNPVNSEATLMTALAHVPTHMVWAGCDLMRARTIPPDTRCGVRRAEPTAHNEGINTDRKVKDGVDMPRMVVIETNSSPSGHKSTPIVSSAGEQRGYRIYMHDMFRPLVERHSMSLPAGRLAVLFDKNAMEASAYACAMADEFDEAVLLVESHLDDQDQGWFFKDGVLFVRPVESADSDEFVAIRAAVRYVTQVPWARIPLCTSTLLVNPIAACVAGGRNKLLAAKAYESLNQELASSGCNAQIITPHTLVDARIEDVPEFVRRLGGKAVVKIPYSNAGQGIFPISTELEISNFERQAQRSVLNEEQACSAYKLCIVQQMIQADHATVHLVNCPTKQHLGSTDESMTGTFEHLASESMGMTDPKACASEVSRGRRDGKILVHCPTLADKLGHKYVFDLRVMIIHTTNDGYRPVAMYARRASRPVGSCDMPNTWEELGTNLSVRLPNGRFMTDEARLIELSEDTFELLDLSEDDLIDAVVQTILAAVAIDKMATRLQPHTNGPMDLELLASFNADSELLREMRYAVARKASA